MLLFLFSCGGSKELQDDGTSYFSGNGARLNPSMRLFHVSSDSSVLHYRVRHEELLYTRAAANAPFTARVKVRARVFDQEGKALTVDSSYVEDEGKGSEGTSYGELPLSWPDEVKEGRIEVLVKDVERGRSFRDQLFFDRKGVNAPQNFLPVDPNTGKPFFRPHFPDIERVRLRYERKELVRLFVRVYQRDFPLPPPPFADDGFKKFDYAADSLFTLQMPDGEASNAFEVPVPEDGFYHFQADSSSGRKGFTLFHFREGYPRVNSVEALLGPIRYITSKKEYKALEEKENTKAAVDSFWVARGGSKERAKKLIESYYQRVENANRHFTSHVEGWKTDRGLIHVIFGEPVRIERTEDGERWIYGERNEVMTLTFDFQRVKNPFTKEDMALERDPMYKRTWYRAVETWRNGRVYSH
jgi:GWxTD domain-containing protein